MKFLLLALAAWIAVAEVDAREVLLIGQEGQISWTGRVSGAEGISTISPEYRSPLEPNVTELGNAPADLIEFFSSSSSFKGSLLPRQVGPEQNLGAEVLDRGGSLRAPTVFDLTELQMSVIFEDMLAESPTGQAFERKETDVLGTQLILDLGARFGVNKIRFFPRNTRFPSPGTPFHNDFLKNFELEINDGLVLTSSGNPIWETYEVRDDNEEQETEIKVVPPRYIRFIRLRATSAIPFEIEKFQVFGEGFFPTARYISPIIDMGSRANWGLIRIEPAVAVVVDTVGSLEELEGDADKVDMQIRTMQIRTRSGKDDNPLAYTRRQVGKPDAEEIATSVDNLGQPLERREYLNLPISGRQSDPWERGSVRDDRQNWSPWTSPYPLEGLAEGTQILSPGPSQYFQFSVDFKSDDLEASHVLHQIALEFSAPPLADELVGEIYPREVPAAKDIEFVYAVRTVVRSPDVQNFDSFIVPTPGRAGSIKRIEIVGADGAHQLDHTFVVQDAVTDEGDVAVTAIDDGSFTVRFPPISEHGTLLKIHFVSRVLAFSTRFPGRALLLEEDGFQGVTSGDAGVLGEGDFANESGITVLSRSVTRGTLLGNFSFDRNVLTPNGDRVNDELGMSFEILAVIGAARITVDVYDLSGRRVRRLFDVEGQNGVYDASSLPGLNWDGTDDQGARVAPGLYLVKVEVDGDARTGQTLRPIGVAY